MCEDPEGAASATGVEALFRAYSGYVAAVALRLLGRDDEIDDVVQEAFVVAMKGLSALRDEEAVKGWLATVTVRIARRKLRLRRLWGLVGLDEPGPDIAEYVAPGASAEDRALLGSVYSVLDALPVAERIAWTLRHVEGEPLEDVARLCGCSLATAKRRIAAAHEKLERLVSHG